MSGLGPVEDAGDPNGFPFHLFLLTGWARLLQKQPGPGLSLEEDRREMEGRISLQVRNRIVEMIRAGNGDFFSLGSSELFECGKQVCLRCLHGSSTWRVGNLVWRIRVSSAVATTRRATCGGQDQSSQQDGSARTPRFDDAHASIPREKMSHDPSAVTCVSPTQHFDPNPFRVARLQLPHSRPAGEEHIMARAVPVRRAIA